MNTTTTTAPNTLERHIADSLAAADAYDAKAMQALTAGDRAAASLLRVSARMLEQLVGAGALAVI